jgi:hypothetical protein
LDSTIISTKVFQCITGIIGYNYAIILVRAKCPNAKFLCGIPNGQTLPVSHSSVKPQKIGAKIGKKIAGKMG